MPFNVYKVIIPNPNPNLSNGPYNIYGIYDNAGTETDLLLSSNVSKATLVDGAAVSASTIYTLTKMKVTSQDAACNFYSATSSIAITPVPNNNIFVHMFNYTDNDLDRAAIRAVYYQVTNNQLVFPSLNFSLVTGPLIRIDNSSGVTSLFSDNQSTNYPIYGPNSVEYVTSNNLTQYSDYTFVDATGSLPTTNWLVLEDLPYMRLFIRVETDSSLTTQGRFTSTTPSVRVRDNTTGTLTSYSPYAILSGSNCSSYGGNCDTNNNDPFSRVYAFNIGRPDGNKTIQIRYYGQERFSTITDPPACVDPDTMILVSETGITKKAGDLVVGDMIYSYDYKNNQYGYYKILNHSIEYTEKKYLIRFIDGSSIIVSDSHKFMLADNTWRQVFEFTGKETLKGVDGDKSLLSMELINSGDVVAMEVQTANTYISNGVVSHNRVLESTTGTFQK
jgi:hypothetical protein